MPELPEVENARALIAEQALGRRIVGVDDADTFVCRPHSPGELGDALTGRLLSAAHRRGKAMWCETTGVAGGPPGPGPDLGIHLGMSGRTLRSVLASAVAKGGAHTGDVIAARRPGGTCPRCGAEMRHGTVGGRSTWWCSREQAWPPVADELLPDAADQR